MEHVAWVLSLRDLEPATRLVLLPLAHHADMSGWCWPSVATLSAETGLSERHVQRQLRALAKANEKRPKLIEVDAGVGRGHVSRYRLIAPSINKGDTQVTFSGAAKGDAEVTNSAQKVTSGAEKVTSATPKGDTGVTQNRTRIKKSLTETSSPLNPPKERALHVRCVFAYLAACGDNPQQLPETVLRRYYPDAKVLADGGIDPSDVHDCTRAIMATEWFRERRMRPKFATVRERLAQWLADGRPKVWREVKQGSNGRVYAGTGALKQVLASQGKGPHEPGTDRTGGGLGAGEVDAGVPRQLPGRRHDGRETSHVA